MATRMSRVLARSLGGRLYSTKVAAKQQKGQQSGVVTATQNNVKIAAVENGGPVSRVTFMVKAGSRYEDFSNLGVTHLLRHFTHLSTAENSSLKVIKDVEISGGGISTTTTRDYASITFSCTRDKMADLFSICAPAVTRSALFDWDVFHLNTSFKTQVDVGSLQGQPELELLELLHGAAFRGGSLGNSLYISPRFIGKLNKSNVMQFVANNYTPERTAIAASNVDIEQLAQLVSTMKFPREKFAEQAQAFEGLEEGQEFTSYLNASAESDGKARYVGGESRVPAGGLSQTYVAFATEGPSLTSPELLSASVLQNIIGLNNNIKYSTNKSGSKLASAVEKSTNVPFELQGLSLNYTDSGLFGFSVSASPDDIGAVLKAAFKAYGDLSKSGVTDEEVQRGKNQLKSAIAMELESSEALVDNLAQQLIGSDKIVSVNDVLKMVDNITTADVVNAAKKFAGGKPTLASLGNLQNVPLLEDLLK
ncbi:Cytochrome b-c1 complex subunit 2 [Mactra antiquata]